MEEIAMYNPPYYVQKDDEYSIYNYYKSAIRMRNTFPVIARGTTTPVKELEADRLGVFFRSVPEGFADPEVFGPESLLIIFNNSNEETSVELARNAEAKEYTNLCYQLNTATSQSELNGTRLTVAPYGIVILKK